jgi:hypothetical protein
MKKKEEKMFKTEEEIKDEIIYKDIKEDAGIFNGFIIGASAGGRAFGGKRNDRSNTSDGIVVIEVEDK